MDFIAFIKPIIDLPVAHAWRGHGSTIFLELGQLQTGRTRKDGSIGNAKGEFTVFIDPNWRIEGKRSIICGSDDTNRAIENALQSLIGNRIVGIATFGHLQELEITLGDRILATFSAWKGQPGWTIHQWEPVVAMYSRLGKIKFDRGAPNNSFKPTPLRGAA